MVDHQLAGCAGCSSRVAAEVGHRATHRGHVDDRGDPVKSCGGRAGAEAELAARLVLRLPLRDRLDAAGGLEPEQFRAGSAANRAAARRSRPTRAARRKGSGLRREGWRWLRRPCLDSIDWPLTLAGRARRRPRRSDQSPAWPSTHSASSPGPAGTGPRPRSRAPRARVRRQRSNRRYAGPELARRLRLDLLAKRRRAPRHSEHGRALAAPDVYRAEPSAAVALRARAGRRGRHRVRETKSRRWVAGPHRRPEAL